MAEHRITCQVCGQGHLVELTEAQVRTGAFVFACPDLDRRYRLVSFYVDSRRGFFRQSFGAAAEYADGQRAALRDELGPRNFEQKFKRWVEVDYPPLGLIDEYPDAIAAIINAYSMGYWYPAVISSCCLAERILNRLVLRCRDHFKNSPEYKKVYRKSSFDDWGRMLDVIERWQLVPDTALQAFHRLMPIRHQTIHYNADYNFEAVAPVAVNNVVAAVTATFGVMNRRDIYLVFDVPGEVWVRSDAEGLAFVKEFVLPHCYHAHAVHEIDMTARRVVERLGRTGVLSDSEFVSLRKESQREAPRLDA